MSNNQNLISALRIKINLAAMIPNDQLERVAWLEKYGPVAEPSERECVLVAPARDWVSVGLGIRADGSAFGYGSAIQRGVINVPTVISSEVAEFLCQIVAATGPVLMSEIAATPIIEAVRARQMREAADEAARLVQIAERDETQRQAREKAAAAREAAVKAQKAEMEAWIAAQGSVRLRRCVAEGIKCAAAYRDERLALERPGWEWDMDGVDSEPRNPSDEAFALLDEARKTAPDAKLNYLVIESETDEEGNETDSGWRGYVAQAEFLGYTIRFGGPR